MFIKKDAKLIIDLMNLYLPKSLAENNDLIIAGGFALNAFMVNEVLLNMNGNPSSQLLKSNLINNPIIPFSDIDLWIKKDYDKELLLNLFSPKDKLTIPDSQKNIIFDNKEGLYLQRSSDWANTFNFSNKESNKNVKLKSIQCIVKKQDSVESLLSSFDLGICSVAIHNGEFIVHQSFFDSLKSNQLTINNPGFMKKTLPSRVFQALRHFKYNKKTGFEFSKDLYQKTLNTMSDANTYWLECKKAGAISQWGSVTSGVKVKITTNDNYEQEIVTKESTSSMIKTLASHFDDMRKMSHWDISHALFIGDSDIFRVKNIIEKSLEKANLTNTTSDNVLFF